MVRMNAREGPRAEFMSTGSAAAERLSFNVLCVVEPILTKLKTRFKTSVRIDRTPYGKPSITRDMDGGRLILKLCFWNLFSIRI